MSLARLSTRAIRPAAFPLGFRSVAPIGVRLYSTPTPVEPKEKANSFINALPGSSVVSKTGILATATGGAVYAISNGLYVVNDESILVVTFFGFVYLISKVITPMYGEWANSTIKSISDILNSSRSKHVELVQDRISHVSNLKDVVSTTEALFEISKETAELEAQIFELKQKTVLASEAKSVLESWVRYENSIRQQEQEQLASAVIANVQKEVSNPKFQDKVLLQAVEEVEKIFKK